MRTYYEMFSEEGNKACARLAKRACNKVEGKGRVTKEEIVNILKDGLDRISLKHSEVYDTEPSWHIVDEVNKSLKSVGYAFTISRFDF